MTERAGAARTKAELGVARSIYREPNYYWMFNGWVNVVYIKIRAINYYVLVIVLIVQNNKMILLEAPMVCQKFEMVWNNQISTFPNFRTYRTIRKLPILATLVPPKKHRWIHTFHPNRKLIPTTIVLRREAVLLDIQSTR